MARVSLILWALFAAAPAAAAEIAFIGMCPSTIRVERSKVDVKRVEVYCVGESTPALTLTDCPAPAQVTTTGADKKITCPNGSGLPVIIRPQRR